MCEYVREREGERREREREGWRLGGRKRELNDRKNETE